MEAIANPKAAWVAFAVPERVADRLPACCPVDRELLVRLIREEIERACAEEPPTPRTVWLSHGRHHPPPLEF